MAKLFLGTREVTPSLAGNNSSTDWGETLQGDVSTDATFICAPYKCAVNHRITSFSAPNMSEDSNLYYMFYECDNLESISFPTPEHILARQFQSLCNDCTSLTSVPTFSNTITIDLYGLSNCFYGCTSLTTAPTFASLTTVGISGLTGAFKGCTSLTTAPTFASLTTIGTSGLSNCFSGCSALTTAPTFANLTTIGEQVLSHCFDGCTSLTTAPTLANVTTVETYGLQYCFSECTSLTTAPTLANVTSIGKTGLWYGFNGCTSLTTPPTFASLTSIGEQGLQNCFQNTKITSLSFPALTSTSFGSYPNPFNGMLYGVTGCTIHFPSNLESTIQGLYGYPNFGGTNTTLAFDLPATS